MSYIKKIPFGCEIVDRNNEEIYKFNN
jgi:hypothetical protein